jgi:non-ribosomal peptide synthetase component E (peptide arylation enzyme)
MSSETQEEQLTSPTGPPSIVYGPSSPIPINMTFGELLDHHAEVRGDRPAVISHVQGYTASFKELRHRSLQLARAMAKDGIGKGDLVAISMGSRVEYFEVFAY